MQPRLLPTALSLCPIAAAALFNKVPTHTRSFPFPASQQKMTRTHFHTFCVADSTRCGTVAPTVPSGGYLRGSDPVEVRLLTSLSNPCCAHPKRFFNHTLRRVGP